MTEGAPPFLRSSFEFDHGRQIGRGFSHAPDRTTRATPLERSSYSLALVGDRVVLSHLHLHLPRRTLQVATPQ